MDLRKICTVEFLKNRKIDEAADSNGMGIVNLSHRGRTDVKTNLNLSPWELFVLNDLIFKMTSKQCPKWDQDVMSAMKDLLSEGFKKAPMMDVQNLAFLPSYSHLVKCMDYLEEHGAAEMKKEEGLDVDKSKETDWVVKDAIISTKTTVKSQVMEEDKDALANSWLWGFQAINQWIKGMFTFRSAPKRRQENEEEQQELKIEEHWLQQRKRQQERRIDIAYRIARQNFANFFHEMSKIVQKSCPMIHRPNKVFMRYAMMDMTTWATLEHRKTVSKAAVYFRKHEVLKMVHECLEKL